LSNNVFSKKTVIPFLTFGGGGQGRSIEDIKSLCSKAVFLKEFSITGRKVNEAESDIRTWLKDNDIVK